MENITLAHKSPRRPYRTKTRSVVFKNRINEYRRKHDLTCQDCAEAVGVTYQAIHRVETYNRGLNTDKWMRLAKFLGVDLEVLRSAPEPP